MQSVTKEGFVYVHIVLQSKTDQLLTEQDELIRFDDFEYAILNEQLESLSQRLSVIAFITNHWLFQTLHEVRGTTQIKRDNATCQTF